MKSVRNNPSVLISKKGGRWLDGGHPWLYESDVLKIGEHENGAIVDVFDEAGKYYGSGFISDFSKIKVRIISKDANDKFDAIFWKRRLAYCWNYRKAILNEKDLKCCRVVFGESDQMPGLTVDRFDDVLVCQFVVYGLDLIKNMILDLLYEVMKEDGQDIKGIYIRNDVANRKLEGLELTTGWYSSKTVPVYDQSERIIEENGIKYYVDIANGQKTGFFLDQKFNRQLVANIAHGKTVLDCFTHTGSFGLNAAKGGAKKVVSIDISALAIEQAKRNAELNNLNVEYVCDDVFAYLDKVNKRSYDFIILDPPAFTKSRATVKNAFGGYKEINYKAMKILGRGGYLATCSCSHFMSHELFEQMLKQAAKEAGVSLKQISVSQQGKDHPILWNVEETDYLKFYIFQII